MGLDVLLFQADRGGDPALVKKSQSLRGVPESSVDEIVESYQEWNKLNYGVQSLNTKRNTIQKDITAKKKAKENADDLLKEKNEVETQIATEKKKADDAQDVLQAKVNKIGNIVHDSVPVSQTEDDNKVERTWHPDGPNGQVKKREDILPHHEVMYRLELIDAERGQKIAGHRGFFLIDDGVDLAHALIAYGLDFLKKRKFRKVQTPYMMQKEIMGKTAQLEEFDENLYKLSGDGQDDKYLIATSEQPISAYHSDEWFTQPEKELPKRYAGFSTCFRKEAGAHGRDTWGIFRVHQFEKVEQFCVTDPASSWEMFDEMVKNSEDFYQSLGLPYQVVSIVSGALNNAAAKKYDLEAWFPFQGAYKELVSVSNCTDYQSRALEVRCGVKKQGDARKVYVHMLNGTLVAVERCLCCIVENYQTPEGFTIPPVLRPYMQNREFLPWVRELPASKGKK